MKPSFRTLSALVLLLPFLSLGSAYQPSPWEEHEDTDLICHGETCYPSVFRATDEFQIIQADQTVPRGLHIRVNMETGVKEGKINVPGEGTDLEEATVNLPPGDSVDLVIVEEEEPKITRLPLSAIIKDDGGDGYGAIKPPSTADTDQLTFADSVAIVLDAKAFSNTTLNHALTSLENLVHEIYWGLKLADPKNVKALLQLILKSEEPKVRSSSALVLGSALSNNPKALKSALGGSGDEVNLIETLVVSLRYEKDNDARARIMYALGQAIKSPETNSDFLRVRGLPILRELWDKVETDGGEFKGKVSTFVEDNFLNEDMKAEQPNEKPSYQERLQKVLGVNTNSPKENLQSFCAPFQTALVASAETGITDDDVKSKLLNALVALRENVGTVASKGGCELSKEFVTWYEAQIEDGKSVEQFEDDGEWFKALAFEKQGSILKSEGWFSK